MVKPVLFRPILKTQDFQVLKNLKNLKNLKSGNFRSFNFVKSKLLLFQVKICKSTLIYWSCYYFVMVIIAVYGIYNLHVLLGRIFVSRVPSNLKTQIPLKNKKQFKKNLMAGGNPLGSPKAKGQAWWLCWVSLRLFRLQL